VAIRRLNVEEVLRWGVNGRRLFGSFVDILKRPQITRINANKCRVFRASRIFPWLSELSVALNVEEVLRWWVDGRRLFVSFVSFDDVLKRVGELREFSRMNVAYSG
jgi:hypothetical protein